VGSGFISRSLKLHLRRLCSQPLTADTFRMCLTPSARIHRPPHGGRRV